MLSIARGMDDYDIAAQVRLERQVHKGAFLLVEGSTDIKRFTPFIDEIECSPVNCYGRSNAMGAVRRLSEDGFPGILAVVDADFDRMIGSTEEHENIIFSFSHDLDTDWMSDRVLRRYLDEVADATKLHSAGGISTLVEKLNQSLYPLSVLRWLNKRSIIDFALSDMRIEKFYSPFAIDVRAMVIEIFHDRRSPAASRIDELCDLVSKNAGGGHDLRQMTNGHDFAEALGICLRSQIGSRRHDQTWGREVSMHLRLSFNDDDFRETHVFRAMINWEQISSKFIILDGRFRSGRS